MYKYSLISLLVSFVSTNLYWILTSLHVKTIVNYGERASLWGLEATIYNIKAYGIKTYLDGMLTFFTVTFCIVIVFLVITHKVKLGKFGKLLFSLGIGFIGAIIYYLFFVGLRTANYITSEVVYFYGLDFVREVGIKNALGNIIGIWGLMTMTIITTIIMTRLLQINQGGQCLKNQA